jgi:flagellar motility protein MotE (MotC chaperone)
MREPRDGSNYHDPEWPPVRRRADPNRVQERIEEIAREEMLTAHQNFREWLVDQDARQVAALVATTCGSLWDSRNFEQRTRALEQARELLHDYTQYRAMIAAHNGEYDRIALQVAE